MTSTPAAIAAPIALLMAALLFETACKRQEPAMAAETHAPAPRPVIRPVITNEYIGRWAAAPTACDNAAWVIEADRLQSPGPLSCTFVKVEPSSAGYTAWSECKVGQTAGPTRLVFTMSGSKADHDLTIEGGPFAEPVALERCAAAPARLRQP